MTVTYAYSVDLLLLCATWWGEMGIDRKVTLLRRSERMEIYIFRNGQYRRRALTLASGCVCLSDVEQGMDG